MTKPDKGWSAGHKASTAWAMAPPALPAPNTKVRPLGGWGNHAAVLCKGKARCTAASKSWRRNAWGSLTALEMRFMAQIVPLAHIRVFTYTQKRCG
jgi:hypothetical protein